MFRSHIAKDEILRPNHTKKILLIEDDPDDVTLFQIALRKNKESSFNYELAYEEDLKSAVNRTIDEDIDIIFLDLSVSGSVELDAVEKLLPCVKVPVIVLTGRKDRNLAKEAIRLGAQDYLVKGSVDGEKIDRAIVYALERKSIDQIKDEFISTISHEIRTPLSIIKAAVSNLGDEVVGSLNEDQTKIVGMLENNVERLTRIIDHLLDMSRLESGKFQVNLNNFDINELIYQICGEYELRLKDEKLEISSELESNLPLVKIDGDMVMQVFHNIITNAIRYARKKIVIFTSVERNFVKVGISNDGDAINENDLEKIFDRFVQINRPIGGQGYKGTGLGLPLCKLMIQALQGQIWAENSQDKHTTFYFTLPLSEKDQGTIH